MDLLPETVSSALIGRLAAKTQVGVVSLTQKPKFNHRFLASGDSEVAELKG